MIFFFGLPALESQSRIFQTSILPLQNCQRLNQSISNESLHFLQQSSFFKKYGIDKSNFKSIPDQIQCCGNRPLAVALPSHQTTKAALLFQTSILRPGNDYTLEKRISHPTSTFSQQSSFFEKLPTISQLGKKKYISSSFETFRIRRSAPACE